MFLKDHIYVKHLGYSFVRIYKTLKDRRDLANLQGTLCISKLLGHLQKLHLELL